MQNQQQMTTPPSVLSTKDHLYLKDMLNWNLLAMKKAHFMAEQCQDQTLKTELERTGQMHHNHYNTILEQLHSNQSGNQTVYMQ
ncbi:hypothetical protein PJ311_12900 [Bacillus sp. CLL-7-23]|uniref:Spore coat protein n=1 Tax=Bacillus changyiensis TaxID=3004103 RepID=A0ABT4X5B7_9BACI|nr:hypothetical protein [Bacillus changyiensis]MDA7027485.1 hypothetical protein [Bacillus changyiensis]